LNLFVTDPNPTVCAMNLDDKRIGKLLMECNQMMSLAIKSHWPDDNDSYAFWETPTELTSGQTYLNHPVSIWVRQTRANFLWTLQHAVSLSNEFQHRFNRDHASANRLTFMRRYSEVIPDGELTSFQNSAKNGEIDFTFLPVPDSYRHYLAARWCTDKRAVNFTGRNSPEWRFSL
jgi:hypothetical protein